MPCTASFNKTHPADRYAPADSHVGYGKYYLMKKILLLSWFFVLLSMHCYAASDEKKINKPLVVKVGYVTDNIQSGCSCSFYWNRDEKKRDIKIIFSSDLGNETWMNLNGKDVKLKLLMAAQSEKNNKRYNRFYEIYEYDKMKIRVDYHMTWSCLADDPENDACEVTYYDLNITFTQNGQHKSIKAKGVCGC